MHRPVSMHTSPLSLSTLGTVIVNLPLQRTVSIKLYKGKPVCMLLQTLALFKEPRMLLKFYHFVFWLKRSEFGFEVLYDFFHPAWQFLSNGMHGHQHYRMALNCQWTFSCGIGALTWMTLCIFEYKGYLQPFVADAIYGRFNFLYMYLLPSAVHVHKADHSIN